MLQGQGWSWLAANARLAWWWAAALCGGKGADMELAAMQAAAIESRRCSWTLTELVLWPPARRLAVHRSAMCLMADASPRLAWDGCHGRLAVPACNARQLLCQQLAILPRSLDRARVACMHKAQLLHHTPVAADLADAAGAQTGRTLVRGTHAHSLCSQHARCMVTAGACSRRARWRAACPNPEGACVMLPHACIPPPASHAPAIDPAPARPPRHQLARVHAPATHAHSNN